MVVIMVTQTTVRKLIVQASSTAFRLSYYLICLDNMCVTPVTLLEGRRRIDGAVLTASKSALLFPPSGAKLDGHGWCSAELGADIFDPYLEVDFGTDVLFAAIVTQGFANSKYESPGSFKGVFIERYQVELARNDGHLWYLARSTNSSQAQAAVSFVLHNCMHIASYT